MIYNISYMIYNIHLLELLTFPPIGQGSPSWPSGVLRFPASSACSDHAWRHQRSCHSEVPSPGGIQKH